MIFQKFCKKKGTLPERHLPFPKEKYEGYMTAHERTINSDNMFLPDTALSNGSVFGYAEMERLLFKNSMNDFNIDTAPLFMWLIWVKREADEYLTMLEAEVQGAEEDFRRFKENASAQIIYMGKVLSPYFDLKEDLHKKMEKMEHRRSSERIKRKRKVVSEEISFIDDFIGKAKEKKRILNEKKEELYRFWQNVCKYKENEEDRISSLLDALIPQVKELRKANR